MNQKPSTRSTGKHYATAIQHVPEHLAAPIREHVAALNRDNARMRHKVRSATNSRGWPWTRRRDT